MLLPVAELFSVIQCLPRSYFLLPSQSTHIQNSPLIELSAHAIVEFHITKKTLMQWRCKWLEDTGKNIRVLTII